MTLSTPARLLIHSLKKSGADEEMVISILVMLGRSEEAMAYLLFYLEKEHPTIEEIANATTRLARSQLKEALSGYINPDA